MIGSKMNIMMKTLVELKVEGKRKRMTEYT